METWSKIIDRCFYFLVKSRDWRKAVTGTNGERAGVALSLSRSRS